MVTFLKGHPVWSTVIGLTLVSVAWMAFNGTLSYPYIMLDRQIQSIRLCTFGEPTFSAPTYGFKFTVPKDLCILPHRIFPEDGSIQVVPKGFYFVINEYASGSIVNASKGTFLFEKTKDNRSIPGVLEALGNGGFMKEASTTTFTNTHGLMFTVVRHATSLDPTQYFDWAFALSKDGETLLSVLSHETTEPSAFETLLEGTEQL